MNEWGLFPYQRCLSLYSCIKCYYFIKCYYIFVYIIHITYMCSTWISVSSVDFVSTYCFHNTSIFLACVVAQHIFLLSTWNLVSATIFYLTHWGRVTHICVCKLTIIGSDNGLSPYRRQAIIWTNAGLLLIGPLGTNFSEILIEILKFSFKKMHLKVSSAKRRPFCPGLNVLT